MAHNKDLMEEYSKNENKFLSLTIYYATNIEFADNQS